MAINILYHLWYFAVIWVTILFLTDRATHVQRVQYCLSFVIILFLIGNGLATLLSSAGPCYAHLVNPENTQYNDLLMLLKSQSNSLVADGWIPLWIIDLQHMLWENYVQQSNHEGLAISAMPSMHVSTAVLMALGCYSLNKKMGIAMWVYALFVQIGSVHLAWHYAIDGYVGAIVTIIVWLASESSFDAINSIEYMVYQYDTYTTK